MIAALLFDGSWEVSLHWREQALIAEALENQLYTTDL